MASPERAPSPTADAIEFEQVLREFDLMFRYALSEGLPIDDKTRLAIAAVQQKLAITPPLPKLPPTPDLFGDLLAAHIALSQVIAPATPLSLRATEPASEWLGSLRRPPLVLGMIIVAVVAAIGFVVSNILLPESKPGEELTWCFAAALGAVFYVLFTALGYVKDRTFDPRYTPLYVIRFVLGVLAGLILAIVLKRWLNPSNSSAAVFKNLGPSVIALLGGFSTEAVYQILQRLVDILVAAVQGDNSDAAKTKASHGAQKELLTLADDPGMPPELKSKAIAAAKKVGA